MIDWYFKTNEMMRKIIEMSSELLVDVKLSKEEELEKNNCFQDSRTAIKKYTHEFKTHWEKESCNEKIPSRLLNHVGFGADIKWGVERYEYNDYRDIIMYDLPLISKKADEIFKDYLQKP